MEFFANDPNIHRLPPKETRLVALQAEPYPDGQRVRVTLELTPFQSRPYLELSVLDADGNEVAAASIVEPMGWKLELTLHIRKAEPAARQYTLHVHLSYPDLGEIDQREITLGVPARPNE